jgi:hypothetical protein
MKTLFKILLILQLSTWAYAKDSLLAVLNENYLGKNFTKVRSELQALNKKQITPKQGVARPDGYEWTLHQFIWSFNNGHPCILEIDVKNSSNVIVGVSLSSKTKGCNRKL